MIESEPASDSALLAAHVAGDLDAFGHLFARHRDRLWAISLRTMGNPEDAADGLQDGLIAAYRRADSYRGDALVTTWLHRVVVNACLDRLRAKKVRATHALPDGLDLLPERELVGVSSEGSEDPAEASVRGERRRAVCAALAQLPYEQRAALVLVDMEGFAVAEAAQILDCAPGTVKSRCSRGRSALARLLAELMDPGDEQTDPQIRRNQPSAPAVPFTAPPRAPPPDAEAPPTS